MHYLDDERFVMRYRQSLAAKAMASARIRRGSESKGISRESTEKAMRECEIG